MSAANYSIASRHIATWEQVVVDPGPDRLVIQGRSDITTRTSSSASLGVSYDQIDQLIIDLLTAKRDHAS